MKQYNTHRISTWAMSTLALFGVLLAAMPVQSATSASISGKWRGQGTLVLKSGSKERFRCNVNYHRVAGQDFSVKARCANGSGSFDQTGQLRRVNNSRYVGTIRNLQFNVSGSVAISVSGNSQNVTISSSEGSAKIKLTRR